MTPPDPHDRRPEEQHPCPQLEDQVDKLERQRRELEADIEELEAERLHLRVGLDAIRTKCCYPVEDMEDAEYVISQCSYLAHNTLNDNPDRSTRAEAAKEAAVELYHASDYIGNSGSKLGAAKLRNVADALGEAFGFEVSALDRAEESS